MRHRQSTATMDEVAKAAGISRATLHRHFAGRDAWASAQASPSLGAALGIALLGSIVTGAYRAFTGPSIPTA